MEQSTKVKETESVARRVMEAIEREIPPDTGKAVKLSSRAELAARYNVSLSTVTLALKQLQRRKMVHWVPGKGIYSGSGTGASKPCNLALVGWFSHLANAGESPLDSYRWYLLNDLISEGAKAQFQITVVPNDEQGPVNFAHLRSGEIDALFLKDVANAEVDIPAIRKLGVPIICDSAKYSQYGVPYVAYDNVAMVRQLVGIFASRGHKRIGYIGTETSHPVQNEAMRQAFFTSLVDAGLIYDYTGFWRNANWAEWRNRPTVQLLEEVGYRYAKEMLAREDRPTAIFSWQSHMTVGISKAAAELGLSVPHDVSLITDAIEPSATQYSTFTQPHRELARSLLERTRQIFEDPTLYFEDRLEKHFVDQGTIRSFT